MYQKAFTYMYLDVFNEQKSSNPSDKKFISESCRKNASCHSIVKTSKKNMPVLLKFSNILSTVIE